MFSNVRWMWALVFLCSVFPLACRTSGTVPGSDGISALRGSTSWGVVQSTIYAMDQGNIHASLAVKHFSDARFPPELLFAVGERGSSEDCSAPLAPSETRFSLLQKLFRNLLRAEGRPPAYSFYYNCYKEVDDRLIVLAATSDRWHHLLRQPDVPPQAYLNCVAELLNSNHAYSELTDAVRPLAYRVSLSSANMENLKEARVGDLSIAQRAILPGLLNNREIVPTGVGKAFLLTRVQ